MLYDQARIQETLIFETPHTWIEQKFGHEKATTFKKYHLESLADLANLHGHLLHLDNPDYSPDNKYTLTRTYEQVLEWFAQEPSDGLDLILRQKRLQELMRASGVILNRSNVIRSGGTPFTIRTQSEDLQALFELKLQANLAHDHLVEGKSPQLQSGIHQDRYFRSLSPIDSRLLDSEEGDLLTDLAPLLFPDNKAKVIIRDKSETTETTSLLTSVSEFMGEAKNQEISNIREVQATLDSIPLIIEEDNRLKALIKEAKAAFNDETDTDLSLPSSNYPTLTLDHNLVEEMRALGTKRRKLIKDLYANIKDQDKVKELDKEVVEIEQNLPYLDRFEQSEHNKLVMPLIQRVHTLLNSLIDPSFSLTGDWEDLTDPFYANSNYFANSQEKITLLRQLNDTLIKCNLTNPDLLSRINRFFETIDEAQSALAEFNKTPRTLWYTRTLNTMTKDILPHGRILSRIEQFRQTGEANFKSGGMHIKKAGDDSYIITHANGKQESHTWESLKEVKGDNGKYLLQEMHQVCTQPNRPYFYSEDCALVMPAGDVLPNHQLMTQDGLHLFDPGFDGSLDSPGFNLDLSTIPYLVVVNRAKAAKFLQSLSEHLNKDEVARLMQEHVVIIDNFQDGTTYRQINSWVIAMAQHVSQTIKVVPNIPTYEIDNGTFGNNLLYLKSD